MREMDVGLMVKIILIERGMTQKELASMVGVSDAGMSKLCSKPVWRTDRLAEVAKALDVKPSTLIELAGG